MNADDELFGLKSSRTGEYLHSESADEMFEKLGYKKYTSDDCILFMKDLFQITFIIPNKTFITEYKQGDYNFPKISPFEIGKELNAYLKNTPSVPNGINLAKPNNLNEFLIKI